MSGVLDAKGELPADAAAFGEVVVDKDGKPTVKAWEMARVVQKNTIPPKGSGKVALAGVLPPDAAGPVTVTARRLYRSASPAVVALALSDKTFAPKTVQMARAEVEVPLK